MYRWWSRPFLNSIIAWLELWRDSFRTWARGQLEIAICMSMNHRFSTRRRSQDSSAAHFHSMRWRCHPWLVFAASSGFSMLSLSRRTCGTAVHGYTRSWWCVVQCSDAIEVYWRCVWTEMDLNHLWRREFSPLGCLYARHNWISKETQPFGLLCQYLENAESSWISWIEICQRWHTACWEFVFARYRRLQDSPCWERNIRGYQFKRAGRSRHTCSAGISFVSIRSSNMEAILQVA